MRAVEPVEAMHAVAIGRIDHKVGHDIGYLVNSFKAAVEKRDLQRETGWHIAGFWGLVVVGVVSSSWFGETGSSFADDIANIALFTLAIYGLILGTVVGFQRGTEGQNDYGPDPLGNPRTIHLSGAGE